MRCRIAWHSAFRSSWCILSCLNQEASKAFSFLLQWMRIREGRKSCHSWQGILLSH
nr:MAG TPA: hypothetical protein [Caudoviricetes sp.]